METAAGPGGQPGVNSASLKIKKIREIQKHKRKKIKNLKQEACVSGFLIKLLKNLDGMTNFLEKHSLPKSIA